MNYSTEGSSKVALNLDVIHRVMFQVPGCESAYVIRKNNGNLRVNLHLDTKNVIEDIFHKLLKILKIRFSLFINNSDFILNCFRDKKLSNLVGSKIVRLGNVYENFSINIPKYF